MPRTFLVRGPDGLLAMASFSPRQIAIAGRARVVLALAGVASHPSVRGQGYGRAVVRAALGYVDNGSFDVAYFQTSHRARPFYEALGARTVTCQAINSLAADASRPSFLDELQMIYPDSAVWTEGVVDTLGPGW